MEVALIKCSRFLFFVDSKINHISQTNLGIQTVEYQIQSIKRFTFLQPS